MRVEAVPKSKNCWQAETTSMQLQTRLKEQQAYIDTVLAGKTADTAGADDAAVLKEIKAQYPEAENRCRRGLVWRKRTQLRFRAV